MRWIREWLTRDIAEELRGVRGLTAQVAVKTREEISEVRAGVQRQQHDLVRARAEIEARQDQDLAQLRTDLEARHRLDLAQLRTGLEARHQLDLAQLRTDIEARHEHGLAQLRDETEARHQDGTSRLRAETEALRSELAVVRRAAWSGRQVDLVDFGELRVFMYTDDLSYAQTAERYKHKTSGPDWPPVARRQRSIAQCYDDPEGALLPVLLAHYWLQDIPFTFVDIGCQYGTSAMATMQLILACGRNNRVLAFDPGVAGTLVPYNLDLNGMRPYIQFEPCAVSNRSTPSIVFTEFGHSENNRVVNRSVQNEALSYVVPSTTLDEYLAEHGLDGPLIVKVDTQGGEPEVFEGMSRALARPTTCLAEFTPHALCTGVDPAGWLEQLSGDFVILDIGELDIYSGWGHRAQPVPAASISGFVAGVWGRPAQYTDLLLLPKSLPALGELVERLAPEASIAV